jgi:hypothetical protein
MLWTIVVILIILWLLGFIGNVGGGLIHLLLVIAVIADRSRRARAQSAEHRRADPAGPADGGHGDQRVGEELAGVRHDLRRGAAAVRGVAVGVRPAVPGRDGEAGRGRHRGAVPAISIEQKTAGGTRAPRWARSRRSTTTCASSGPGSGYAALPECGRRWPADRGADRGPDPDLAGGARIEVLAPLVRGGRGSSGSCSRRRARRGSCASGWTARPGDLETRRS